MSPKPEVDAPSRRERNKQRTRARILAAAAELFAASGVAGTSIDDLAKMADISRATFFNYFSSKAAVVQALAAHLEQDFRASAAHRSGRRETTAERLMGLFMDTSRRLKEGPALYKAIIGESERGYSEEHESQARFDRMHRAIRGLIADGVQRGEVRDDLPISLLVEMVGGVYVAILHNWRVMPNYPLDARLRAAALFLIESIEPATARASAGRGPAARRARA